MTTDFLGRKIVGTFYKQQWSGRRNNQAVECGQEEFDATAAVLLLSHEDLVELQDCGDNTDELGRQFINWPGPCDVRITDAICDFFEVESLEDITPEDLLAARQCLSPIEASTVELTISLAVKMRIQPGIEVDAVLKDLACSLVSNTPGAVVEEVLVQPQS